MALTNIKQGSDIDMIVVIPDDDGNPVNLNDVYNVLISVYHKKTNVLLEKFSILTLSGYSSLSIYDATAGEVRLNINDETTEAAKVGVYQLTAERIEVNSVFTDGYYSQKYWDDAFNLVKKEPA